MSRLPSTKANAAKGTAIRAAGFQTGIHANPEHKKFIDESYKSGKSVTLIFREGCNKFGKKDFPSDQAIRNYIKRYLMKQIQQPETVEVIKYAPDYMEHIKKHDLYLKNIEHMEIMEKRIKKQVERDEGVGFLSEAVRKDMEILQKLKEFGWKMEAEMGFRGANAGMPGTINFNQFNQTNVNGVGAVVSGQAEEWDEDDVLMLEAYIETRKELESDEPPVIDVTPEETDSTETESV